MKLIIALALPLLLATITLADPGHDHAAAPHEEHNHAENGQAQHDHAGEHSHEEQGYASHAHKLAAEESAVDYMWRKSDLAFHAGDYERAIGLHKAIVALEPSDVESYGNAAWLLWSLGRGEEAVAFIERGLKANPDDWHMWEEAGQHYGLQKLHDKEREAYARSVKLIPADEDSQMVRRYLAHAAEKSGDLALSLSTWRGLVKDYPNDAVNKNNLARVEKKLAEQNTGNATQAHLPSSGPPILFALAALTGALCLPSVLSGRSRIL